MAKGKKSKKRKRPTKRYGARYGFKPRKKALEIERKANRKKECPYCGKEVDLIKEASGIFKCPKCNNKFTGESYFHEEKGR